MHRVKKEHWIRIAEFGIAVAAIVVTGAMSGSCVFDTKTNFCEKFGLRCKEGQVCAADQPVCVDIAGCGNNHMDPGEKCDDGNTVDGDGCSADCKSDETCGNGILDTNITLPEECDHGSNNGKPGDSCLSNCQTRRLFCGNGTVDPGEQCDPGDADSESCNSNSMEAVSLGVNCKTIRCGDGYVNMNMVAPEQCDSSGAITASCNGPLCTIPSCGDFFTNGAAGEQCDTGGDTQACNGNGNGNSNNDPSSACHAPSCSDKYANPNFTPPGATAPEQCDDGGDTQTCNGNNNGSNGPGSCRTPACGDKYINANFTPPSATAPEQCDDGMDTQTCNGNNSGSNGLGSCRMPQCGDGYKNPNFTPPNATAPEQCDDGMDTQNCNGNNNGSNGPGSCRGPICGDKYTNKSFTPPNANAPEECDDGQDTNQCNGNNNGSNGPGSCRKPSCGDGYKNTAAGEECDIGNAKSIPPIFPVLCSNQSKTCSNACKCI